MIPRRKWNAFVLVVLVLGCQSSLSQQKYDVVYLKSGGKIVGSILERIDNRSIRIQLQSKEVLFVSWENIKAIEDLEISVLQPVSIYASPISFVPSQNSIAHDTTWEVISKESAAHNVSLDSLRGSFLHVSRSGIVDSFDVQMLKQLRLVRENKPFWTYAGYGSLIGLGAGALIGYLVAEGFPNVWGLIFGAPIGMAAGFVTGGLISNILGIDIVIEMPDDNIDEAKERIIEIFRQ